MRARVSFSCPDCKSRFRASTRFAGRSCACPKCGQKVVVPAAVPEEQAPALIMDDGYRLPREPYRWSA
jgi:DNA-directed RNA polymerase subunit RPC12/RpoP